jgi:hypothetical protein
MCVEWSRQAQKRRRSSTKISPCSKNGLSNNTPRAQAFFPFDYFVFSLQPAGARNKVYHATMHRDLSPTTQCATILSTWSYLALTIYLAALGE